MKSNLVVLLSVALLAGSGYSQNSETASGTTPPGQPTGPTTPGAGGTPPPTLNPSTGPTGPTTPGAAGTPPPSLNQSIGENSFPARQRTQAVTAPGQVPGQIGITNSFTAGTNQFGATNLPPTSQPGFTNRVMGLMLMRDQALSQGDRQLLAQIRISVFGTSQTTTTSGGTAPAGARSVYFILRDGAVRVVGFVPNAEEQNRIVTTVQQVPGVVRVYDGLQVGASAAPGQTPASSQTPASGQTPVPSQTPAPGQPQ
jgi:hypothetical protein